MNAYYVCMYVVHTICVHRRPGACSTHNGLRGCGAAPQVWRLDGRAPMWRQSRLMAGRSLAARRHIITLARQPAKQSSPAYLPQAEFYPFSLSPPLHVLLPPPLLPPPQPPTRTYYKLQLPSLSLAHYRTIPLYVSKMVHYHADAVNAGLETKNTNKNVLFELLVCSLPNDHPYNQNLIYYVQCFNTCDFTLKPISIHCRTMVVVTHSKSDNFLLQSKRFLPDGAV